MINNVRLSRNLKKLVCILVLFLCGLYAFSETIHLKDGSIISGKIISQDEKEMVVETNFGRVVIKKSDIKSVDYENNKVTEQKSVRNGAFMFRPLATIFVAALGGSEFVFEGQTAFSEKWAINAIGDIGSIGGIFFTGLNLGPQYNITGRYLDGLYFGLYPGYYYATDFLDTVSALTAMIELGYQGVGESGFSWGAYIGYFIAPTSSFKFGLKIGYAWPDPWVKIKE